MNTKVIAGIIGIVVFISLLWLGQPSDQSGQANSQSENFLKSSKMLFDFGTISMANGNVAHEFAITNSSDKSVNIRKIYTSCMCTTANFKLGQEIYGKFGMPGHGMSALTSTNINLDPGASGILEVIYDPNAHGPAGVGPVNRLVYLEDSNGGYLKIEIKAVVTP